MEVVLTVEIGTTSCKTIAFSIEGSKLSSSELEYKTYFPKPGWAEQDPDEWFQSFIITSRSCLKKLRRKWSELKVLAVTFTGQMHSLVPVDKEGEKLYNAIILQDKRSVEQCREIEERVGKLRVHELTGNVLDPSTAAPKVLWLIQEKPGVVEKTYKFLPPKDYVRNKLTKSFSTDPIDASGTMMYDLRTGRWSEEILSAIGLDESLLPEVRDYCEVDGSIDSEFSEKTGIPRGTSILIGAGDDVDALGVGAVKPGQATEHMGTTGEMAVVSNKFVFDSKCRVECYPYPINGLWGVGGPTQASGAALKWFKDSFRVRGRRAYDRIFDSASKAPLGSDGLLFLPFLMGERSPLWSSKARGVFYGVTFKHSFKHFARSVLEGVAFNLKMILDVIESLGVKANIVISSGKASKNLLWRRIRADVYGKPIALTNVEEAAPFGILILSLVGLRIEESIDKAVSKLVRVREVVEPDFKNHEKYMKAYEEYRALVEKVSELWSS